MPTPQELLQDPFIKDLMALKGMIEQLVAVFVSQGIEQVLPFTLTPITPALNSSTNGVSLLNQSLAAGVSQIQVAASNLHLPVIIVKGGGLTPDPGGEPIP